jgi:hypothetical protein
MRREFGDFQTPPELAREVVECCRREAKTNAWQRALEPTCGAGAFITALLSLDDPPLEIHGIEIQDEHADAAMRLSARHHARVTITRRSIFDLHLGSGLSWNSRGPLIVIGNPPWVTNAELGTLGSRNLPVKRNVKRLHGLEAMTGASNFDICEAIWLKLIEELAPQEPLIALLCKTAVARNVLQFAAQDAVPVEGGFVRRIDAARWFGAAVDACLFGIQLRRGAHCYDVPVYDSLTAATPSSIMSVARGKLVADVEAYRSSSFADGRSPLAWRQGVKHDASAVMELVGESPAIGLKNRRGDDVDVEPDFVFPMMKGSDVANGTSPAKWMILPQRVLGEDTRALADRAPKLWRYLTSHAPAFAKRKSSIYRGQPPFATFGIGEYTFAQFKVAIAGLSKQPRFLAVGPRDGRPVVFDDTCYFVACRSADEADALAAILNSAASLALIRSLLFTDAKRPITKALLQRVDVGALAAAPATS